MFIVMIVPWPLLHSWFSLYHVLCSNKISLLLNSQAGQMESGKVVLVTAAAGGTGQFAVQVYFFWFFLVLPFVSIFSH